MEESLVPVQSSTFWIGDNALSFFKGMQEAVKQLWVRLVQYLDNITEYGVHSQQVFKPI